MLMPVLVNFKICDNSKDCSGITACPNKVFLWNALKKTIFFDNAKCTACGGCVSSCPVGAIKVAKNQKEFKKLKKEIREDPRKVSDLFIDRYGAQPLHKAFFISQDKFDEQIIESSKLVVAELFNDKSIQCLYCSIPIKDLFEGKDIKYRKVAIEGVALLERFNVVSLPALLFFKQGKLVSKIEGHFVPEQKLELDKKIKVSFK